MAAVNFPTSPSNGDTITNAGITYTYRSTGTRWDVTGGSLPSQIPSGSSNPAVGGVGSLFYNTATAVLHISTGSAWGVVSGSGGSSVTVQETAPTSPSEGDLWFDPSDMVPYIYYNDGNSTQWVNFVSASGGGGGSGSAITVQEEGTALATAVDTFNFVGTGVTASGTGAIKTVTPPSNVATATALATARTIGGVSFDGSADINLPGVNAVGTQNTSGTAAIATGVTSGSSNPAVGAAGALFYNTSNSTMYTSNGSAWVAIGGLDAHDHVITTGGTLTLAGVEGGDSFDYNLGLNFADPTSTDGQLTYTLESGSLPTNAVLPTSGNSAFTGTVTNTQATATSTFSIRGTDPQGLFAVQNFIWTVTNNTPTTTGGTVTIAETALGAAFSYDLGTDFSDGTNTDGQLTYTLESGTLPAGASLPAAGTSAFTGNTTTAATYTFVIRATDTSGLYATQAYSAVVAAIVLSISYEPAWATTALTHRLQYLTSGTITTSALKTHMEAQSNDRWAANGGANQVIYVLLVGAGGASNTTNYPNGGNYGWRFGGSGGGAVILAGKLADFNGASYTIGAGESTDSSGTSGGWRGGKAVASTITVNSTTYTTNSTQTNLDAIKDCYAVGASASDWHQSTAYGYGSGVAGTTNHFGWAVASAGSLPVLGSAGVKPVSNLSGYNTAGSTAIGVFGHVSSGLGTGASAADYPLVVFGGGRGGGSGTSEHTSVQWYGTSTYSGDGGHPVGTSGNNAEVPGGGATCSSPSGAGSWTSANGSIRIYWEV
jgi:hypothetical protein